jgi:hypothetical protein
MNRAASAPALRRLESKWDSDARSRSALTAPACIRDGWALVSANLATLLKVQVAWLALYCLLYLASWLALSVLESFTTSNQWAMAIANEPELSAPVMLDAHIFSFRDFVFDMLLDLALTLGFVLPAAASFFNAVITACLAQQACLGSSALPARLDGAEEAAAARKQHAGGEAERGREQEEAQTAATAAIVAGEEEEEEEEQEEQEEEEEEELVVVEGDEENEGEGEGQTARHGAGEPRKDGRRHHSRADRGRRRPPQLHLQQPEERERVGRPSAKQLLPARSLHVPQPQWDSLVLRFMDLFAHFPTSAQRSTPWQLFLLVFCLRSLFVVTDVVLVALGVHRVVDHSVVVALKSLLWIPYVLFFLVALVGVWFHLERRAVNASTSLNAALVAVSAHPRTSAVLSAWFMFISLLGALAFGVGLLLSIPSLLATVAVFAQRLSAEGPGDLVRDTRKAERSLV